MVGSTMRLVGGDTVICSITWTADELGCFATARSYHLSPATELP
jgi:hypothetical protein